jgi:broad specificity phosphatase PhoE
MCVYFATHASTDDNERGIASGLRDIGLSPTGRANAAALPEALQGVHFDIVVCSTLRRARETAELAFGGRLPIHADPRLREVDYGTYTGMALTRLEPLRASHATVPFPGGESYQQRLAAVRAFLEDFARHQAGRTPLIIGHRATLYSLQVLSGHAALQDVIAGPFAWAPYWEFDIDTRPMGPLG